MRVALLRYCGAMATIQIRELPEETYETIRRRARAAGQSIQAYMREQIVELAARRTKQEAVAAVEAGLDAESSPGSQLNDIIADLAADRR
jgi:plasmid stability protein